MRLIGLLGGMSWQSTAEYYRILNDLARERLGGRVFTDHRLGRDLEIGGNWLHWIQPHAWAEVTRSVAAARSAAVCAAAACAHRRVGRARRTAR